MRRGRIVVAAACLLAGLGVGSVLIRRGLLMSAASRPVTRTAAQGARLLASVMAQIQRSWIDSLSDDQLYAKAREGLVAELGDPNTALLTPERLRRLREVTSGNYHGVGLTIDVRD